MKLLVFLACTTAVAYGAIVPRASFLTNLEDFMDMIENQVGDQIGALAEEYFEDEGFQSSMEYLQGQNFINLFIEMESLPEVNAFLDFLEEDNIQVHFLLEMYHALLGIDTKVFRTAVTPRRTGTGFNGFFRDMIDLFPQENLAALFDEKLENDSEFSTTIANLKSEEFQAVWVAMWENEVFKAEVDALAENGISLQLVVEEVMAIFGQ